MKLSLCSNKHDVMNTYEGMEVYFHASLTSALEASGKTSRSDGFTTIIFSDVQTGWVQWVLQPIWTLRRSAPDPKRNPTTTPVSSSPNEL